jgi:adenine deaminase
MKIIEGNLVDVFKEKIFPAIVKIKEDKIYEIKRSSKEYERYILPSLIDAHIHIESSMLVPTKFSEVVSVHGTTSVISDPHEIANVLGIEGIKYMVKEAEISNIKIFYTAPSCVPATKFETSGAILGVKEIEMLMKLDRIVGLGEVMNFPGVINGDKEIIRKIEIAKKYNKPIDGHCPGLTGKKLKRYVAAGITTDHECTSLKEAKEKLKLGMKIMIREGSSAKNMEELIEIAKENDECFLVSDDKHIEDLIKGHINVLLKKAVELGIEPIKAIKMVSLNPALHYNIPVGLLRVGDPADIVVVKDLKNFNVIENWINGKLIAKKGKLLRKCNKKIKIKNSFKLKRIEPKRFEIKSNKKKNIKIRVIKIIEDQIITKSETAFLKNLSPDIKKDILKIAVVERYGHNRIGIGFVKGFCLKAGAIASSIAHDSHNIIVVGTNDKDMSHAVNYIRKIRGGIVVAKDEKIISKIELPVAGLMSNKSSEYVIKKLKDVHEKVKKLGCNLKSPLMHLSFLALLVIPELKISDFGLFDVKKFRITNIILK